MYHIHEIIHKDIVLGGFEPPLWVPKTHVLGRYTTGLKGLNIRNGKYLILEWNNYESYYHAKF